MLSRRRCVVGICGSVVGPSAFAKGTKTSSTVKVFDAVKIYIPASEGGGWDQTGRGLGAAMLAGKLAKAVEYENKGGRGGTVGLADFSERYNGAANALFVGGLATVGAIAVSHSAVTLRQLTPVARLTSDVMVLVVKPDSPFQSVNDLSAMLRTKPGGVVFTGGFAGGVDHMLAGMAMRAMNADVTALKYVPSTSGTEAIARLRSGEAQVAISGYSELKASIEQKSLMALAVSSRKGLFGIPSLREQGVDTELANWRGVFAHANISVSQRQALQTLVVRATETPLWREIILQNNWIASPLYGTDLNRFVELEEHIATTVTSMLKLKG